MKKQLFLQLSFIVLFTSLALAQGSISGHVYEMHSGLPLDNVKIHIKNKAGLEIGTLPPAYTSTDGFFEFPKVRPNEYRLEVSGVFSTDNGPIKIRLFTDSDVIPVDTSAYVLTIALSKHTADHALEKRALDRAFQNHLAENKNTDLAATSAPDSAVEHFWAWNRRSKVLGSRIIGARNHEIRFIETAGPIEPSNLAKGSNVN